MEKSFDIMLRALQPLGACQFKGGQATYNCPRCEKELGYKVDKFNLEVSYDKNVYHCWACGKKGSLYSLIHNHGYSEFAPLFKSESNVEYKKVKKVDNLNFYFNELKLISACKNIDIYKHLLSRGITKELIIERNINFCYEGKKTFNIVFPSYNSNGDIVAVNFNNVMNCKYEKKISDSFICFYENFINKNSPIIITEGVYDALVVPNAIPLLGTEISDNLLEFLYNTDVIVCLDNDVDYKVYDNVISKLKSVCNTVTKFNMDDKYKDLNLFYVKNKNRLMKELINYYK